MQTLKEEIRKSIVSSALAEFMDKGFQNASMRSIAHAAGITAGNVYRYFDSKDALFDSIMEPVSRQMMELVNAGKPAEDGAPAEPVNIDSVMGSIMRLCTLHATELHILVYKSEGSRFEGVRRRLIDLIAGRLLETPPEGSDTSRLPDGPVMAGAVAASFVEGVFEILKQANGDIDAIAAYIRNLILFFFKDVYKGFGT